MIKPDLIEGVVEVISPGIAIKSFFCCLLTLISYYFNSLGVLFWAFIFIMVIDYITGWLSAYVRKELSSQIGREGIARKTISILIVFCALTADYIITHVYGIDTKFAVYRLTCCAYIINDLLSIFENAGEAGVPVPGKLLESIKILK